MRILAIRGQNLASLEGAFEVDFQREPLASAGLFAITGPTGSGKSTLLDALCLALYDQTPRLLKADRGKIFQDASGEKISPQDSRHLLRRGAGEGFAEVDFVGVDHVAYRARWAVRRARNRARGALQGVQRSLERWADHQILFTKSGEVNAAIEVKTGLNFEQFTRSALLAQNEFGAFLKANETERAVLLQSMTGMTLFSQLSIRAYARQKQENALLEQGKKQLQGYNPLSGEDRLRLEEEKAAVGQALERLEGWMRWREEGERLRQGEGEAEELLASLLRRREETAERREMALRVASAQPARPLVEGQHRAEREWTAARQRRERAEGERARGEQELREAESAASLAQQRLAEAEQARRGQDEPLREARRLDAELAALAPQLEEKHQDLHRAREAEGRCGESLRQQRAERDKVGLGLARERDWREQNAPLERLVESWSRWEVLLRQAGEAQRRATALHEERLGRRREAQRWEGVIGETTAQRGALLSPLREAEEAFQQREEEKSRHSGESLAEERQATEAAREQWRALLEIEEKRERLAAEAAEAEGRLQAQTAMRQESEAALARLAGEKPRLAGERQQAQRMRDLLQQTFSQNVESMRHGLEPGEPCPVCGAKDHPYAAGSTPQPAQLTIVEEEVRRLGERWDQHNREESAHGKALTDARRTLAELESRWSRLTRQRAPLEAAWVDHPKTPFVQGVEEGERGAFIRLRLEEEMGRLKEIAQREAAVREAHRQWEEARKRLETLRRQDGELQQGVSDAAFARDQAVWQGESLDRQWEEAMGGLESLLKELDPAFVEGGWREGWREAWREDGEGFVAARAREVEAWQAHQRALAALEQQSQAMDGEIRGLDAALTDAGNRREEAAQRFARIDDEAAALRARRGAVLQGRSADDVETALNEAIRAAREASEGRREAREAAAQAQARLGESLEQARREEGEREAEVESAARAVAEWRLSSPLRDDSGEPLSGESLGALLGHSAAWQAGEEEFFRALDDELLQAQTRLQERRERWEAHRQTPPAGEPLDEAEEASLGQRKIELLEVQGRLLEQLARDAADRERLAEGVRRVEEQEAVCRPWNQLNELIGSADGAKFRNFAQQFTLDLLLSLANHHLKALSRRYELRRIPETLSLMVIDQFMGDEERTVHSLSGGESFLVSLALALGLASLSANRVRVESLFIDEGFGSLDGESLQMALDALDNLQGSGRKVGVISHIQEMTHRIDTRIQLQPDKGGGRSRLRVTGGRGNDAECLEKRRTGLFDQGSLA
ncbi:MAG: AAA family ATPase [Magnetococcales bacterium]|nr:AAA family ATPase [Magnetococcales bacterium]